MTDAAGWLLGLITAENVGEMMMIQSLRPRANPPGTCMVNNSSAFVFMAKVFGIDLGTTNSRMAVMEGGEPTVLENSGRNRAGGEWRRLEGDI